MKYLTTTFAIAFMAIGFMATPAQDANARGNAGYCPEGQKYYQGSCYTTAQIDELEHLQDGDETSVAGNSSERCEVDARGVKRCELIPTNPSSIFAEEGYDREQDDHGVGGDGSEGDRAAASTSAE